MMHSEGVCYQAVLKEREYNSIIIIIIINHLVNIITIGLISKHSRDQFRIRSHWQHTCRLCDYI